MRRESKIVPFQLKADSIQKRADGAVTFSGYGSVFGNVDSYNDTITKGAFTETLRAWQAKKKLPAMLLQHGGGYWGGGAEDLIPIGLWAEMVEDDHGLYCAGALLSCDTDRFRHLEAALRSDPCALDGLSIGYRTRKYAIDEETDVRTLTEIELVEVSLVTFPANDPARLTDVKAGELISERELERMLRRDAGLSRSQAKAVIAKGFRAVREADSDKQTTSGDELRSLLASLEVGRGLLSGTK